jgi:hypothetical protein
MTAKTGDTVDGSRNGKPTVYCLGGIGMRRFAMQPWALSVKLGTLIIVVMGLFFSAEAIIDPAVRHDLFLNLLTGFFIIYCLVSFILSPRGFTLAADGLEIERLAGRILLPYSGIIDVEFAGQQKLYGSVTTTGIFSYSGSFQARDGKTIKVYATALKQLVRVQTTGLAYYLSPETPEEFVSALLEAKGINHEQRL